MENIEKAYSDQSSKIHQLECSLQLERQKSQSLAD